MKLFHEFVKRCKQNITVVADWACAMFIVALAILFLILGTYLKSGQVAHQSEGTEARFYNNSWTAPAKTTCIIEMKTDTFKTEASWIKCSRWWRAHLVAEELAFPNKKNNNNIE